jgi:hypothetical protein
VELKRMLEAVARRVGAAMGVLRHRVVRSGLECLARDWGEERPREGLGRLEN